MSEWWHSNGAMASSPPSALQPLPVSDGYAWAYACLPIAGSVLSIEGSAMGLGSPAAGWLLPIGLGVVFGVLAALDARQINRTGVRRNGKTLSPFWFLIAPVYLWRRATFAHRSKAPFWVFMGWLGLNGAVAFIVFIVAFYAGVTGYLPACKGVVADHEVRKLVESLPKVQAAKVTLVSLNQVQEVSVIPSKLRTCKGVLLMSGKSEHALTYTFEQRTDDIYVQVSVQ